MKKVVETSVKTYNGNADIFFSVDGETIGSTSVYYSSDDLDTDEDCDYNMNVIKSQLIEYFENNIKKDGQELDMDKFNFEIDTIAIYVSPRVK